MMHLLKIYVPTNTPGIYIDEIARRNECETLLMQGMFLGLSALPYRDKTTKKTN